MACMACLCPTTAATLRLVWKVLALMVVLPRLADADLSKELKLIKTSVADKISTEIKLDVSQLNGRFNAADYNCKITDAQLLGQPTVKKASVDGLPIDRLSMQTSFLFSGRIRATYAFHTDKACKSANPTVFKGYSVDVQNLVVRTNDWPKLNSATRSIKWTIRRDTSEVEHLLGDSFMTFNKKMTVIVSDSKDVAVSDDGAYKVRRCALWSMLEAAVDAVSDAYADVMRTNQWIGGGNHPQLELDAGKITKLTKAALDVSGKTILKKTFVTDENSNAYMPIFKSVIYNDGVTACKVLTTAVFEKLTASATEKTKNSIDTKVQVTKLKFKCTVSESGSLALEQSIKFPQLSVTVNAQPDASLQGKNSFPFQCNVVTKSKLDSSADNSGPSKKAMETMFEDLSQQVAKYACDLGLEMIAVSLSNFPLIRTEAYYATRNPERLTPGVTTRYLVSSANR